MNKALITESVIQHWQEKAGDHPTIIFCSTINHATDVAAAFHQADIATEVVHGELSETDRKAALTRYESS